MAWMAHMILSCHGNSTQNGCCSKGLVVIKPLGCHTCISVELNLSIFIYCIHRHEFTRNRNRELWISEASVHAGVKSSLDLCVCYKVICSVILQSCCICTSLMSQMHSVMSRNDQRSPVNTGPVQEAALEQDVCVYCHGNSELNSNQHFCCSKQLKKVNSK